MADKILESFLVAIGFKIDESALARLTGSINIAKTAASSLTKGIGEIGLASVGMATAVGVAVLKVSENLSNLYYMSQRTYTSAQNIREFSLAVRQIGLSSDSVTGQLEGLGRAMRDNPMLSSYFQGRFGTSNPKELVDTVIREYARLIKAYGEISPQVALFRASISNWFDTEIVAQSARNSDTLAAAAKRIHDIYVSLGLDIDKYSGRAVGITRQWETIVVHLGAIWDKLVLVASPAVENAFKTFEGWLGQHDKLIEKIANDWEAWLSDTNNLQNFANKVIEIANALERAAGGIAKLESAFKWLDEHPRIIGALGGAVGGGLIAGPWGALFGGTLGVYEGDKSAKDSYTSSIGSWINEFTKRYIQKRDNLYEHYLGIKPHFQHGGVVSINAHAGEMVLPVPISQGLQTFFGTGQGEGVLRDLVNWVRGSTSYQPFVRVSGMDRIVSSITTGGSGGGIGGFYRNFYPGTPSVGGRSPESSTTSPSIGGTVGGRIGGRIGDTRSGSHGNVLNIPNVLGMTEDERNKLGLILEYESQGGHNVMNFKGRAMGLSPTTPHGYTAQGYFQILNSNWAHIAPGLGITAPNAMAASFEDQTKVALTLLRRGGIGNWSHWNAKLNAALARGEIPHFGVPPSEVSQKIGNSAPKDSLGRGGGVIVDTEGNPHRITRDKQEFLGKIPSTRLMHPSSGQTSQTKPNVTINQINRTAINGMGDASGRLHRHNARSQAQLMRSAQRLLS